MKGLLIAGWLALWLFARLIREIWMAWEGEWKRA